jgi:ER lumen protein retaining receptor
MGIIFVSFEDAFPVLPLIGGALIMGFFVNMTFTPFEVMWSFSLWLEAVASLPQIYMVTQFAKEHNGSIENLTADYMFSVGVYRAM